MTRCRSLMSDGVMLARIDERANMALSCLLTIYNDLLFIRQAVPSPLCSYGSPTNQINYGASGVTANPLGTSCTKGGAGLGGASVKTIVSNPKPVKKFVINS